MKEKATGLEAVVSPRSQLEDARLVIEREVRDVDGTSTAQLGGRWPEDVAVVADHGFAVHVASRVVVSTWIGIQNNNSEFIKPTSSVTTIPSKEPPTRPNRWNSIQNRSESCLRQPFIQFW